MRDLLFVGGGGGLVTARFFQEMLDGQPGGVNWCDLLCLSDTSTHVQSHVALFDAFKQADSLGVSELMTHLAIHRQDFIPCTNRTQKITFTITTFREDDRRVSPRFFGHRLLSWRARDGSIQHRSADAPSLLTIN